jgi:hypothetical protein
MYSKYYQIAPHYSHDLDEDNSYAAIDFCSNIYISVIWTQGPALKSGMPYQHSDPHWAPQKQSHSLLPCLPVDYLQFNSDKNISQAANHKGDVLLGSSCCLDTSFLLVKKDGKVPNTKNKRLAQITSGYIMVTFAHYDVAIKLQIKFTICISHCSPFIGRSEWHRCVVCPYNPWSNIWTLPFVHTWNPTTKNPTYI